ncbi:MAG TPA: Hsp20/alpha crystallin family protein [Acidobacteriota bacterium]|jgi:HSP20 family protein
MSARKHDPFQGLIAIQDRLTRMFCDELQGQEAPSVWVPPVDIYETEERYVLQAEVPGMKTEQIKIQIHDNQLQIEGRRELLLGDSEKQHILESPHGEFRRTFQFSVPLQADQVHAELSDGILKIDLPKKEKDKRRIEIT